MKANRKDYALYKGDEFIDIGKASELSAKYGISENVIYWLAGSARAKSYPHKWGYVVIALPDESEEEEEELD